MCGSGARSWWRVARGAGVSSGGGAFGATAGRGRDRRPCGGGSRYAACRGYSTSMWCRRPLVRLGPNDQPPSTRRSVRNACQRFSGAGRETLCGTRPSARADRGAAGRDRRANKHQPVPRHEMPREAGHFGAKGQADTPGSVHAAVTSTAALDGHLSRTYVAARLKRSTRKLGEQPVTLPV